MSANLQENTQITDEQDSYRLSEEQDHTNASAGDDGCSTQRDGEVDEEPDVDDENDTEYEMSLTELMYGASSYHAIAKPVALTMILAASAAVFINTEESLMMGEQQLAEAYQVWAVEDDSGAETSTGMTLARSFGNAAVMVSVLCVMTFGIVILYKYRFMKCLIGYMIFSSATLLGLMGSVMLDIAIDKFSIPIDVITYFFGLWNFAVVGTVAIFWQLGVPSFVTQGYLVATSVILAWHLSHFDSWTAWTLLVMLALYDLCAVLTPCGPLKALVNAMQEDDAPEMPGLLYTAQLEGTGGQPSTSVVNRRNTNSGDASRVNSSSDNTGRQSEEVDRQATQTESSRETVESPSETPVPFSLDRVVEIPFAVAKIYSLPLIAPPSTLFRRGSDRPSRGPKGRRLRKGSNVDQSSLLSENHEDEIPQPFEYNETYTPEQLLTTVRAQLPRNGGRIEQMNDLNREGRYAVYGRDGELKRVLVVSRKGGVFEEDGDDDSNDSDDEHVGHFNDSIRLGLGDFIFYSVMVAKAAMYSFTTFAACMLVILAGLGATLVLLAVYHHALPALPVSIFLGVLFYLLTRLSIEPWVQDIMKMPLYV